MQATVETTKTRDEKAVTSPNKRAIFYAFEDCQRAVFFNVGWSVYEQMIEQYNGIANPRLWFDRGVLEIMPISSEHEDPKQILALIIEELAFEMKLDVHNIGSTTLRRKNIKRGFEPDLSFYFNDNAAQMRGKNQIDLNTDAAPDLVIEIDITSPSIDKLELFAKVGIAEVWIFEDNRLKFLHLKKDKYAESDKSRLLADVSSEVVTDFVKESRELTRPVWRRKLRDWAQTNLKK